MKRFFSFCPLFVCKRVCPYLCLCALLFSALCTLPVFAAERVQLIPKDVYIGDEAEIRFSFAWNGSLFQTGGVLDSDNADILNQVFDSQNYTVKRLRLFSENGLYVLSVIFIPWQTGQIDIVSFDLSDIFTLSVKPLLIDIPPITIQSAAEKTGQKTLRPSAAPLIIPGTTYVVYAFVACAFVLCALAVVLVMRFTAVRRAVISFFERIFSSRNYLSACRTLLSLERSKDIEQSVFCERLSHEVRRYLEGRFAHPFSACTASELYAAFCALFAGTASEKAYIAMESLCEVCIRCDFVRFAGVYAHTAPVTDNERLRLIDTVRQAFIYFEQPEEPEKENADGA